MWIFSVCFALNTSLLLLKVQYNDQPTFGWIRAHTWHCCFIVLNNKAILCSNCFSISRWLTCIYICIYFNFIYSLMSSYLRWTLLCFCINDMSTFVLYVVFIFVAFHFFKKFINSITRNICLFNSSKFCLTWGTS